MVILYTIMYQYTLIKEVTLTKCAEIKVMCAVCHKNRLKLYLHKDVLIFMAYTSFQNAQI